MSEHRIILADDHELVRKGLASLVHGAGDLVIVGEAGDGVELLELLELQPADLAIVDVSMPRLRGLDALAEARRIQPALAVLVLSMHGNLELVRAAISGGARGYLVKEDAVTHVFAAIERIRAGGIYVSPRLNDAVTSEWAQGKAGADTPTSLTPRERDVLKLVAAGMSSRQIGESLAISRRTVEHHRASMMEKLKLRSTADLVRVAIEGGYV